VSVCVTTIGILTTKPRSTQGPRGDRDGRALPVQPGSSDLSYVTLPPDPVRAPPPPRKH
jgi:hypothetical protein